MRNDSCRFWPGSSLLPSCSQARVHIHYNWSRFAQVASSSMFAFTLRNTSHECSSPLGHSRKYRMVQQFTFVEHFANVEWQAKIAFRHWPNTKSVEFFHFGRLRNEQCTTSSPWIASTKSPLYEPIKCLKRRVNLILNSKRLARLKSRSFVNDIALSSSAWHWHPQGSASRYWQRKLLSVFVKIPRSRHPQARLDWSLWKYFPFLIWLNAVKYVFLAWRKWIFIIL